MPFFTIYDAQHLELVHFSTDDAAMGDSLSVGSSDMCSISLADFPEIRDSIQDMHFSIVKKENQWRIVNPGNDLKFSNGQKISDIELTDAMEVVFGLCRMEVELAERNSSYDLVWEPPDGKSIPRVPLNLQVNLVGSARYCNIAIDSSQIAPEHINIILNEDLLFIEDLNSGFRTVTGGKEISGKTGIVPDKLFYLGHLSFKIISKDTPDSAISFAEQRVNWKFVNVILFLIFIVLSGLILWSAFNSSSENSTDSIIQTDKQYTRQMFLKNIRKDIAEGKLDMAMEEIAKAKKVFKNKTAYNALKQAVSLEISAVENFHFYKIKADDAYSQIHHRSYIKFIFASKDNAEQLALELEFWKSVIAKLELMKERLNTKALPLFKEYQITSFFLVNYSNLHKTISSLRQAYHNYLNLTKEWKKEDWEAVIINLKKIEANIPEGENENFKNYISRTIRIAEFAEKLDVSTKKFMYDDFEKYDLNKMNNQIKMFDEAIQKFKKFNLSQYTKLNIKLSTLKQSSNVLMQLRSHLMLWRKAKSNFKNFQLLAELIGKKEVTTSKFPIMQNAAKTVNSEMNQYITNSIDSIQIKPDKSLLEHCNELENFIIATGAFGTGRNSQKLISLKNKISLAINKKCDSLFEDFQEDKTNAKFPEMKQRLKELLKTAPENSKYYIWAKKQLKLMLD